MAIVLTDDGTLDTVLRCEECGEEFRYNYSAIEHDPDDTRSDEEAYDDFVKDCIEDAEAEHECGAEDEDDEPSHPDEDDITTGDHEKFYQYGSLVLWRIRDTSTWFFRVSATRNSELGVFEDYRDALRRYMDVSQFWPDAWFISDHGNPHLIDLSRHEDEEEDK